MEPIGKQVKQAAEALKSKQPQPPKCTPSSFSPPPQVWSWLKQVMVSCMKRSEPHFQIDDTNSGIMRELLAWSFNLSSKLNPNKGILLCGPIGIGKSTLMRGLQAFTTFIAQLPEKPDTIPDKRFCIKSAAEVALSYSADGIKAFDSIPKHIGLCIDEIGREPLDSKHYGTTINPIQTLLQLRYDNRHNSLTHGTTNLAPAQLEEYYGDYIADRCRELFNIVELTGTSRRK